MSKSMSAFDKPLPRPDSAANRAEDIAYLEKWKSMIYEGGGIQNLLSNPRSLMVFNERTDRLLQWVSNHYVSPLNPLRSLSQKLTLRLRNTIPVAVKEHPILASGSIVVGSSGPAWTPSDEEVEKAVYDAVGFADCVIEWLQGQGGQSVSGQPIIWHHGGESYSRDGKNPVCVSREIHNVLQKFLNCDEAYETKTLEKAGVSNVASVMSKIAEKFGDEAIRRPGKSKRGDGYFIRVRSRTSKPTS
jgi:hypothetical protein